jgi:Putative zinc-finger
MDVPGGQLCARARFWVSLRVDDELSELEAALLDAHLSRCGDCCEFALGAAASAAAIRAAAYVGHTPLVLDLPRAPHRFVAGAGIAALVAAAAIAGGLVRSTSSPGSTTTSAGVAVAVVSSVDTPDQLRRLRRTTLLNERRVPRDLSAELA